MFKIIVTDDRFGSYQEEKSVFKNIDYNLEILGNLTDNELQVKIKDADALLVNQRKIGKEAVCAMRKCRVISRYGTGYDNVDVEEATKAGIWVARVPDYCFEEVGDHALALLFACARRITFTDKQVKQGNWDIHIGLQASRISGKVLGILGYGGTGRCFHRKASCIGFSRILICDHKVTGKELPSQGVEIVSFDTLLRESDFLSLHIPMREENYHIISSDTISIMKQGAVIINTSRGRIIDSEALVKALKDRKLDSAGIDVFDKEPPLKSGLLNLDNIVLSDHCAYYSRESLVELKTKAAGNILQVLSGKAPLYPVNKI